MVWLIYLLASRISCWRPPGASGRINVALVSHSKEKYYYLWFYQTNKKIIEKQTFLVSLPPILELDVLEQAPSCPTWKIILNLWNIPSLWYSHQFSWRSYYQKYKKITIICLFVYIFHCLQTLCEKLSDLKSKKIRS